MLQRFLLMVLSLAMAACSTSSRHGDATLTQSNQWLVYGPQVLRLPEFSISKVGVHRFRVVDLAESINPSELCIPSSEEDKDGALANIDPPWVGVVLNIQLSDKSGAAFYRTTMTIESPRSWNHIDDDVLAGYFLPDLSTQQPMHRTYEVLIEIVTPSSRPGDVAWLEGRKWY
jgi:hypothetical protein